MLTTAARLAKRALTTAAFVIMWIFGLTLLLSSDGLMAAGAIALSHTESQLDIAPHQLEKPPGRQIQDRYNQHVPNTLNLRVAHADWRHMRHAMRVDIENHGGTILGYHKLMGVIPTATKAAVNAEYAQHLIENSHRSGSYLTAGYPDWARRVETGQTVPEMTGKPTVEVRIRILPMPFANPPLQKAINIMAIIWLLSATLMLAELALICAVIALSTATANFSKQRKPETASKRG